MKKHVTLSFVMFLLCKTCDHMYFMHILSDLYLNIELFRCCICCSGCTCSCTARATQTWGDTEDSSVSHTKPLKCTDFHAKIITVGFQNNVTNNTNFKSTGVILVFTLLTQNVISGLFQSSNFNFNFNTTFSIYTPVHENKGLHLQVV